MDIELCKTSDAPDVHGALGRRLVWIDDINVRVWQ